MSTKLAYKYLIFLFLDIPQTFNVTTLQYSSLRNTRQVIDRSLAYLTRVWMVSSQSSNPFDLFFCFESEKPKKQRKIRGENK